MSTELGPRTRVFPALLVLLLGLAGLPAAVTARTPDGQQIAESIKLPAGERISRLSPVLWRIRSQKIPGRELYRPLPVADVDQSLYQTLTRTMEDFGFNMGGWSDEPDLQSLLRSAQCAVYCAYRKPSDNRHPSADHSV